MPEMDGFELAANIRETESAEVPVVVMLTSGERLGESARRAELGVADCLIKPVKQSELLNCLLRQIGVEEVVRFESSGAESVGPPQRPLKVLVAEDGEANRLLAVTLLKKWGHTPVTAVNGREAVQQFSEHEFDLVLMDMEMPELDGISATREIRRYEAGGARRTPILALTANALEGDRQRCLEAGMDDYLAKPIRARRLFDAINSLTAKEPAPAPTTTGAIPPAKPDPAPPSMLNRPTALEMFDGDEELLLAVAQAARREIPVLLSRIVAATDDGDAPALKAAAHALMGNIRYFGVQGLDDSTRRLESLAQLGNLSEAAELLESHRRDFDKLVESLDLLVGEQTRGAENSNSPTP